MAIQMITLATITDRRDFNARLDREAFGTRQQAEEWARERCKDIRQDDIDDGEPGERDPVAEFEGVCLTDPDPIAYFDGRDAEADTAATDLANARRADAWSRLDEARD